MGDRPRSLWIASALQAFQGFALIFLGSQTLISQEQTVSAFFSNLQTLLEQKAQPALFPFGMIVSGALMVLCTIALIRKHRWAWTLSMAIQGAGLAAALVAYGYHQPNYTMMVMGVMLVFYLNHQEIQAAFRQEREAA